MILRLSLFIVISFLTKPVAQILDIFKCSLIKRVHFWRLKKCLREKRGFTSQKV